MKPKIHEDSSKHALISFLRKQSKPKTISVIVHLNMTYGNNFRETGTHPQLLSALRQWADRTELFSAIKEVFKHRFNFAKPEPFLLAPILFGTDKTDASEE